MATISRQVFVTGASGYLGRHLIPKLLDRGHRVTALVRAESAHRIDSRCQTVVGQVMDRNTYWRQLAECDTVVHLVGVAHPSPAKAAEFRRVDLVAAQEVMLAAAHSGTPHFVYVSVAHPAPLMRAYIAVRQECEAMLVQSGLPATILRPWYVLGPGHYWPCLLLPLYWLAEQFPTTRAGAQRCGLASIQQMTSALVHSVEHPSTGQRIMEVPEIRRS